jgi:hypothetical protein
LGTTAGTTSGTATIDFSGLVPASGSPPVTAYLVASAAQVQEQPVAGLGPPVGHPDYSATFSPYTGYVQVSGTLQLTATTTAPDNFANIEIARTVLSAGQTNIVTVSTAYQPLAGSVLAAGQAAANVGALGGCLSGLLPNPLLALVGDVAAPGYIEIPSAAGTLILQWFTQTFTPSQTVLEVALSVTFPNGYLAGAAVDSPLTLSPPTGGTFKYTVFEGGAPPLRTPSALPQSIGPADGPALPGRPRPGPMRPRSGIATGVSDSLKHHGPTSWRLPRRWGTTPGGSGKLDPTLGACRVWCLCRGQQSPLAHRRLLQPPGRLSRAWTSPELTVALCWAPSPT